MLDRVLEVGLFGRTGVAVVNRVQTVDLLVSGLQLLLLDHQQLALLAYLLRPLGPAGLPAREEVFEGPDASREFHDLLLVLSLLLPQLLTQPRLFLDDAQLLLVLGLQAPVQLLDHGTLVLITGVAVTQLYFQVLDLVAEIVVDDFPGAEVML